MPTFAAGARASRTASTRSTTPGKRGCIVGSPLPAKVIQSGRTEGPSSVLASASATISGEGQRAPSALGALKPHSQ